MNINIQIQIEGQGQGNNVLDREVGPGFCLQNVLAEVATHFFDEAITKNKSNMSKVADDLGFKNYQTAQNWARKYATNRRK